MEKKCSKPLLISPGSEDNMFNHHINFAIIESFVTQLLRWAVALCVLILRLKAIMNMCGTTECMGHDMRSSRSNKIEKASISPPKKNLDMEKVLLIKKGPVSEGAGGELHK